MTRSRMSDMTTNNLRSLDDQDESVRIAVRALGDMRNGQGAPSSSSSQYQQYHSHTPALSVASTASTSTLSTLATPTPSVYDDQYEQLQPQQPDYLSRVSGLPIVNSALRASMAAYEQGKASSRVVKYSAEMVESSISTISRPVMGRLNLSGRQKPCTPLQGRKSIGEDWPPAASTSMQFREPSSATASTPSSTRSASPTPHADSHLDRSTTPTSSSAVTTASVPFLTATSIDPSQQHPRTRWQTVLLEAGGISAAVSEENMRRLKYCLQWLHHATAQIDAQILALRDFIASLQPSNQHHGSNVNAITGGADGANSLPTGPCTPTLVSAAHMKRLAAMKAEVVNTVREAVAVVSKYAGGALPEPARSTVRTFILSLPQRWNKAVTVGPASSTHSHRHAHPHAAHLHEPQGHSVGASSALPAISTTTTSSSARRGHSTPYSRPASPISPHSPASPFSPLSPTTMGTAPTTSSAAHAAERVLTLATESLDMIRGVTGVMRESLDRAETWVERFRAVGIQRGVGTEQELAEGQYNEGASHGAMHVQEPLRMESVQVKMETED